MKPIYFFCLFLLGVIFITKAQNNKAINQVKIKNPSTCIERKDLCENLKKVKDDNVINSNDTEFKCNTIHHKNKILSNYIDTIICTHWNNDTLEWENGTMEITHYNLNGDIEKQFSYLWENNSWANRDKRIISYYSNNNLIKEEKTYKWKDTKWENYGYDYYKYDNNNNLTFKIFKWEWNKSMNDWEAGTKDSVIYNADNLITEHYSVFYDCCGGWGSTTWDFDSKLTYAYDSNLALIQETLFSFNKYNSIWEPGSQLIYTYDSLKNLNTILHYYWVDTNNQWVLYFSTIYSYDTNNYLVNYVIGKFDSSSYIYTNNYLSTTHQHYSWNTIDSIWIHEHEYKVENDINGNLLSSYYIDFGYLYNSGAKSVMNYDSDNKLTDSLWLVYINDTLLWDSLEWYHYKYTIGDYWLYGLYNGLYNGVGSWDSAYKCHGTYFLNTITNIESSNFDKKNVKISPNPAVNVININISDFKLDNKYNLKIYDVFGRLIMDIDLLNDITTLSALDISNGLYYCILYNNNVQIAQEQLIIGSF